MLPIVPVQQAYAASYRDCLDTVARERRYLAQVEALPLERVEGFVKDSVASDAIQFFALDGERVVGWADVFSGWAHAVQHCGTLGMGVHPGYRRQGLGRRLLQACIDKAWAKGLRRITLEARADNHAAIALYESMGFRHEALKAGALCFDGVDHDAVQMRLLHDEFAPPAAPDDGTVRFDTKVAVVVREDLPVWQKLNVTAFLMSGLAARHPDMMGRPYVDADGAVFNALCGQPIICMAAEGATLQQIHRRALERGVRTSAYTEEMFATGHDAANREVFRRSGRDDARIVGVALRASKKVVDKITSGARMHP